MVRIYPLSEYLSDEPADDDEVSSHCPREGTCVRLADVSRPSQAQERERIARRKISDQADEWRRIAGRLPFWEVDRTGDEITLHERGRPLATLHGEWATTLADYLQTMDKAAGVALAELLWCIGGHGDSRDVRRAAEGLLGAINVDGLPRERRPDR